MIKGRWDEHFILDVFQTGSGTSTNMNANEVIANRANEILGGSVEGSTDRSIPTTMSTGDSRATMSSPLPSTLPPWTFFRQKLLPALRNLHKLLKSKARAFHPILKIGRTHLQDATPVRLGQEFGGYARQMELGHPQDSKRNGLPL